MNSHKEHDNATEWLIHEDQSCQADRAQRLEWLIGITPAGSVWQFPGGLTTKQLFEEARYCFVYGQFLATVLLGLSYVEKTIASELYAGGDDSARRVKAVDLVRKALNEGYIFPNEYKLINRCRKIRNAITHFRKPFESDSPEIDAFLKRMDFWSKIEEDATSIMQLVMSILRKRCVG